MIPEEDGAYASRNSIVVAQFRHVNQWVEAMRANVSLLRLYGFSILLLTRGRP